MILLGIYKSTLESTRIFQCLQYHYCDLLTVTGLASVPYSILEVDLLK